MDNILGYTFIDCITGFTGVATGHVDYISGCNQTLLCPKVKPDGSLPQAEWFDDQRLSPVINVERVVLDNAETPGFDTPAPRR